MVKAAEVKIVSPPASASPGFAHAAESHDVGLAGLGSEDSSNSSLPAEVYEEPLRKLHFYLILSID